jgi:hypothetical protein
LAFRDLVKALIVQNLIVLITDKEKRLNKLIKSIDAQASSENFNRTAVWEKEYYHQSQSWPKSSVGK